MISIEEYYEKVILKRSFIDLDLSYTDLINGKVTFTHDSATGAPVKYQAPWIIVLMDRRIQLLFARFN